MYDRRLKDTHIWLSIVIRHAQSNFTSVQRLSCCLSQLLTYMLVNIMFYGVDAGPGDQRLDIGLYTISLSELVIGNLKILHKRFR